MPFQFPVIGCQIVRGVHHLTEVIGVLGVDFYSKVILQNRMVFWL